MLDKGYLKDDGNLDIERINRLPLFEHMHVISSMNQEQYKQYLSEYVSKLPKENGPVIPIRVDHRLAEAQKRGIAYDPKKVEQIDGVWCLGECPELDRSMALDGSLYLRIYLVRDKQIVEQFNFVIDDVASITEDEIQIKGSSDSPSLNQGLTLIYNVSEGSLRHSDDNHGNNFSFWLPTFEITSHGQHNAEAIKQVLAKSKQSIVAVNANLPPR